MDLAIIEALKNSMKRAKERLVHSNRRTRINLEASAQKCLYGKMVP